MYTCNGFATIIIPRKITRNYCINRNITIGYTTLQDCTTNAILVQTIMISIIIPTYNTALLIERTLRSVLEQNGKPEIEVLVVDDCSTDNTLDLVRAVHDSRIRIFQQESNHGPAAARNRGLCEARGEYCAFLDGDDYWAPEFLNKTSAFLDAYPDAVAVSVLQYHKIIGKPPVITPHDTGITQAVMLENFYEFWAKYNHVCTGSVLMRTATAQSTGGQREDLRICEDLEFWALLATYGKWGFIPEVLFTSDGGAVTREIGWQEKNRNRWASAVPTAEWEKRLVPRIREELQADYQKARGRIARNLSYSLLLSNRTEEARKDVLQYGKDFPGNRVNRIYCTAAQNKLLWNIWCALLNWRESRR